VFPEAPTAGAGCGWQTCAPGILQPILIGRRPSERRGVTFIDPGSSPMASKYAAIYYDRRARRNHAVEAAQIARRRYISHH